MIFDIGVSYEPTSAIWINVSSYLISKLMKSTKDKIKSKDITEKYLFSVFEK